MENNKHSDVMDKNNSKEEIDLVGLLNLIWESKKIIVATTAVFSIVAVIYSLSLPDIYESKALLSPVNEDIASNQSMGNVSGLANLAGISISNAANSNSLKAIKKVFKKINLKDKNWKKRKIKARFKCALAIYGPGFKTVSVIGKIEGTISKKKLGSRGFGYDPIFIPTGKKITFGQMRPEMKHKIDHRFKAFKKIRKFF